MHEENFVIRPFHPTDQAATKQLILAGLVDHWGTLNPTLNPDLNDIAQSYQGETFLLAVQGDDIVGCGALIEEEGDVGYGRIVRMSVKKTHQRQGIGQRILKHLETAARQRHFHTILLETTETWDDAISFYLANGYKITHHQNGDTHFEKKTNG